MIIIDYRKSNHKLTINACVKALRQGRSVVYPTDTSYGLAVDATNIKALKKLYRIKGRGFSKPVHLVAPSLAYAKKIVRWGSMASKLAKRLWPGALTLVLKLKAKSYKLKALSAGTGFLGIRVPNNKIALDLAKHLKHPITATSANRSGQKDCYSAQEVLNQFKSSKYKPDIILSVGRLPKRKPSTVVNIDGKRWKILRLGPIAREQIENAA